MRSVQWCAVVVLVSTFALSHAARAVEDLPNPGPGPAAPSSSEACASFEDFVATACPLTWHGITIYGAYDVGVGWVSHGLPENGYNYEGESLVNRNGQGSRVVLAPNNLQQTGLGIKGRIEFMQDWYAVFNASTGINPQSGQLANMAATNTTNNGLPRSAYSITGDGARAGQAFNDELYAGASSTQFGTLTFGRQRSLGTDTMLNYDPAGGSYSFSYIGYNGTMAGGGDTEDTRWDEAIKYSLLMGRCISARCINLPTGRAAASPPPVPGAPPPVPRNRRITPPMDLTWALKYLNSPSTRCSNITARRSAY